MLKTSRLSSRGFTIVEVMVALTLGMLVIAASLVVFSTTFSANSTQIKASRVNNDLRAIMTQITRDLRRAGFQNWMVSWPANKNFLNNLQTPPALTTTTATVTYDLDSSGGAAGTDETFAFRWVDLDGDGFNDSVQSSVGASGNWTNLNDPAFVRIHTLDIQDISLPSINPTGSAAAVQVPVFEITLGAVHVSPLCPAPQCAVGQACSSACITRTMVETVRVRNPILTPN